jgi:hypothetical protein
MVHDEMTPPSPQEITRDILVAWVSREAFPNINVSRGGQEVGGYLGDVYAALLAKVRQANDDRGTVTKDTHPPFSGT